MAVLVIAWLAGNARPKGAAPAPRHDVDARIRYYSNKVAEDHWHYPAYALLGAAYLDKARETHDPGVLEKARAALKRSLELQPNFAALSTMTAVCNFSHRFEEAIRWGRRAARAWPQHTGVTAMLVEAHLGIGQYNEAAKLLPPDGQTAADFDTAVARAQWLVSQGRDDDAVDALLRAAELANDARQSDMALWAQVRAAGVLIHSGWPSAARPLLDAAARLDGHNPFLRLHRAELFEAEGEPQKALAACEALLQERSDPEVHRITFRLARKLGRDERAQTAFEAAEKAYQRAIEAGEVYSLEALARLYLEAGVHLDRARALAERNLEYKRDQSARALLTRLQGKTQRQVD